MPRENLAKSIDTAITFQKLLETLRDIVKQLIQQNPDLNDELSLVMVVAYNGTGNLLVRLFEVMEQLTERKSVFGDEGIEKIMQARIVEDGEDDDETPDDEEEVA